LAALRGYTPQWRNALRLLRPTILGRRAGRSHAAFVLEQNHRNDLSVRVAFGVELRVDRPVNELVLGAREDRDCWRPDELRFEMIALEREIKYSAEMKSSRYLPM